MILALLATAFLGDVKVILPMHAETLGTEIELGEIAEVTGGRPEDVARVKALELGYAPSPGYSRVLVAQRIREQIRQKLPTLEVEVVGQRAIRVVPKVTGIAPEQIQQAARGELERRLGTEGTTFQLVQPIPAVEIPAGHAQPSLRARTRALEAKSGSISLPVDILIDGARYRTIWTTWKVEVFATRPVLKMSVKQGEELMPGMLVQKRVKVTPGTTYPPLDGGMVIGAVAKRDLRAGETVTAMDVRRPTVVTVGEPLVLCVQKGPIMAKITVQALESGSVGDRIRVRAAGTGSEIIATVRSRDYCELHLP